MECAYTTCVSQRALCEQRIVVCLICSDLRSKLKSQKWLQVCFFAVSQRSRGAPTVGLAFSNTIQLLIFYTYAMRLVTEAIALSASVEGLAWLAACTPIDGADDVNNAGKELTSTLPILSAFITRKQLHERIVVTLFSNTCTSLEITNTCSCVLTCNLARTALPQ